MPNFKVIIPAPPVQENYRITKLAFRNRFTFMEKVLIETEAQVDVQVKVVMDDQREATFIDLKREDTIQGVYLLVSKKLITPQRAEEILNNPIQDEERPEK